MDPETQLVTCQSVVCDGNSCDICEFTVCYDRLVLTVGAQTNTFGIPGVREYCCFLKQVEDARRIRTAIVNCFERANLPNLTDEEREHDLTFAVIGAGTPIQRKICWTTCYEAVAQFIHSRLYYALHSLFDD